MIRYNTSMQLQLPAGTSHLLLHTCCGPCAGGMLEWLLESGIQPTVFFFNPNIYPLAEYERRKAEIKRFAIKRNLEFIDADYQPELWVKATIGLEHEPERGKRCTVCFDLRLRRSAEYAKTFGYDVFATSLGISRWKNQQQVYACGRQAAATHGIQFWDFNWRKQGGQERMLRIIATEQFYRQDYCGCQYSMQQREGNDYTVKS